MIKKIIGGILIAIGVGLALYVGLWLMFIGGIIGIAMAIQTGTILATVIAWNAIKIILASFVGIIIFYIFGSLGMLLIAMD